MISLFRPAILARWAAALLMLLVTGAEGAERVALSGRVLDQGGGPLPGATVSIRKVSGEEFQESSTTNSEGYYVFRDSPMVSILLRRV